MSFQITSRWLVTFLEILHIIWKFKRFLQDFRTRFVYMELSKNTNYFKNRFCLIILKILRSSYIGFLVVWLTPLQNKSLVDQFDPQRRHWTGCVSPLAGQSGIKVSSFDFSDHFWGIQLFRKILLIREFICCNALS